MRRGNGGGPFGLPLLILVEACSFPHTILPGVPSMSLPDPDPCLRGLPLFFCSADRIFYTLIPIKEQAGFAGGQFARGRIPPDRTLSFYSNKGNYGKMHSPLRRSMHKPQHLEHEASFFPSLAGHSSSHAWGAFEVRNECAHALKTPLPGGIRRTAGMAMGGASRMNPRSQKQTRRTFYEQ